MFKFKKVEEMKWKIKQLKIVAIAIWVIFVLMLLNILYLDYKISQLIKNQDILLQNQ